MNYLENTFDSKVIKYDTNKYNFRKYIENLFDEKLENLSLEKHKLETMEDNCRTKYHKLFYDKLHEGFYEFTNLYDKFIKDVIVNLIPCNFIYQITPSFRIQYQDNLAAPEFHIDTQPGFDHPEGEINFILPLTNMFDTNSLWIESEPGKKDFKVEKVDYGEFLIFNGAKKTHGNKINKTKQTRVSIDFRILPLCKYNPNVLKTSSQTKRKFIIGEYYKKLDFKIYFPPNWGLSSKDIIEQYIPQTPNNDGKWDIISYVTNIDEADILIIEDTCDKKILSNFKKNRIFYFSREALDTKSYKIYKNMGITDCSFWNNMDSYLYTKWHYKKKINGVSPGICKTYDELINLKPINKNKKICCILSNKNLNEGHILRKKFMYQFMKKYPNYIDLYGTCDFANKKLKNNDKFECLKQYKYCIGFDNQDNIKKFFGTQLTDAILCWTIPVFWCGTDLNNYFPNKSFISFDCRNLNEIDRLYNILINDNYNDRLEDLKEARLNILNKYNMWPTIVSEINKNLFKK